MSTVSAKHIEERINSNELFDLSKEEIDSFEFFLTTSDNSFDPFEEFSSWFAFDSMKNYNSSGLLARIVDGSTLFSSHLEKKAVVMAMHRIVRINASGMHRIVVRQAKG